MIVKNLSRKSNGSQLLRYVFRYVLDKDKNLVRQQEFKNNKSNLILRHNLRSRSINGYIKEFKENESYRLVKRKDSVILHHTILSFSNRDKELVTDSLLKSVTKKYIELRSPNSLHLAVKHADKEHIHCHVITSGVQLNGRSSRISKQQFKSLKLNLDRFQREKFPLLTHSLPEHGKSTRLAKESLIEAFKAQRQTNKETLVQSLEKAYANSTSKDHFLTQLKEIGYSTYTRNTKLQGIMIGDTKYRFSRLGFDEARLKTFNKEKTKSQLLELQEIRKGCSHEIKKENRPILEKEALKGDNDLEQKRLDELADIRDNRSEKNREKEDDEERSRASDNKDLDNIDEEDDEQEN